MLAMKAPEAKIVISIGRNRRDKMWRIQEMTWSQLVERLSRFKTGDETHQEYLNKSKDEQSELKDVGGFVGGAVNGGRRVIGSVATRTLFTGDADHADDLFLFNAEISLPFSYVIYNTRKHGPTGHRYRLVVPFDRPCNAVEYGAVSRYICRMLGMNLWDKTTLEMNRLMYWPSHSRDVPLVFDVQNRGILNVDSVLATYKDYTDISGWAKFPTETEIRVGNEKGAMQDPREKPHVIGAFCRAYGVNEAIAQFLPDVYRVSSHDPNRYTFIGGESSNGAVVYDNLHLYSNHQTDPVHGKSLNAFDLVRVHKFGHLDADLDDFERLDLRELPSQIAMVQWANDLPEIRNEIAKTVLGDFERARDLIEGATGEADLRHRVITEIKHIDMQPVDREKVAKLIQQKLEQMAGAKVQIGICRDLIAPRVDVLSESDSPEWVQGYFYILTENRFYNISNGALLDKSGFNALFNRRFQEDENPNAADWLLNRGLVPTVLRRMYVPYYNQTFTVDDQTCVNTYRLDTVPKSRAGTLTDEDKAAVALVRKHIRMLFNEREELAGQFEQWLAHNVQRPGVKIRYAWLIKGCEGDGKTTIANLLSAVMGGRHVKIISLATATSNFNDYAHNACVGVFEEIRAVGHNRHDTHTTIKPLITNDRIEIHAKGLSGFDVINTMNYLLCTNHVDALPLNEQERRFGVVFSPFNSLPELEARVGNYSVYFERLHNAINNHAPALRTWLESVDLSTFNPNARAPATMEKGQMGQASKSDLEIALEEILEGKRVVFVKTLRDTLEMEKGVSIPNNNTLGRLLPRFGFSCWCPKFKFNGVNSALWGSGEFLSTESCRTLLEAESGVQGYEGF
jgi:hypothetical protein